MKFSKLSVSPKKYVVIDVETTGLKSKENDLLSISIYKPDDGKSYERFLPLELSSYIPAFITEINGIQDEDVKDSLPLSQDEVNRIVNEFELKNRIILHYGNLDEKFIKEYFRRHNLIGFNNLNFFNFKKLICSPSFTKGLLTKDNLCNMFGIEGVKETHNGLNDCILEWKLFVKMAGCPILVKKNPFYYSLYRISNEFIVPVSYLNNNYNLSKLVGLPKINVSFEEKDTFRISSIFVKDKIIERKILLSPIDCIYLILNPTIESSRTFLSNNFKSLKYLGYLSEYEIESDTKTIRTDINRQVENIEIVKELSSNNSSSNNKTLTSVNEYTAAIKNDFALVIDYIKENIFLNEPIKLKELVVNSEYELLGLCDLSNENCILEIVNNFKKLDSLAIPLYIKSKNRNCYIIQYNYLYDEKNQIEFKIFKAEFHTNEIKSRTETAQSRLIEKLAATGIIVVDYKNTKERIRLKCNKCGKEWETYYNAVKFGNVHCKYCYRNNTKL